MTGACFKCGKQGHFLRDCPHRSEAGTEVSEPTVQYPRQGGTGTPSGRGRGQGQAASTAQTRGRQGTQGSQQQGQARVFALTHQEAAATPEVITGKIFYLIIKFLL